MPDLKPANVRVTPEGKVECLTAERAFAGETLTDVPAAVVERELDWTTLPAAVLRASK